MNIIIRQGVFLALFASAFTIVLSSFAATPDIRSDVQTGATGNMYATGGDIDIATPVPGDLFAAGGRVRIEREIGVDAAIAGGEVRVRAPVRQDLRLAAGNADIDGAIGGELLAAGGMVKVSEASTIAGPAWLAGGDVTLAGRVGKDVKVAARRITVSGEIGGDAHLYGQEIRLLQGAKINGDLFYASPNELVRDPSAQVLGTITREEMPGNRELARSGTRVFAWFHPLFVLSMLATGVLLLLLLPGAIEGTTRAINAFPLRCLGAGAALLFALPPVAVLFMITVIGIPLGLAVLALYPAMLLLGYLAAAFYVGRKAADMLNQPSRLTLGRQTLFLALGLILMNLAVLVPFLGGVAVFALLLLGIGSWAVSIHGKLGARKRRVEAIAEEV